MFRFRIEERIRRTKPIMIRFRLRNSFSISLSERKLDVGEKYILAHKETVTSVSTNTDIQFDKRTSIAIGQFVRPDLKVQIGHQYRLVDIINVSLHQVFLVFGSHFTL